MPTCPPCAMVIFGASGDLAKLKLIPAMYELAIEGLLSEDFVLVGYARTSISDEDFRKTCSEAIAKNARTAKKKGVDQAKLKWLLDRTFYHTGQYDKSEDFDQLKAQLAEFDKKFKTQGNRLFYLSRRGFVDAEPEIVQAILKAVGAVNDWAAGHAESVAAELAPSVGIPAPILSVALGRLSYGVTPLDQAAIADQQRIADTFHGLGLLPKPIRVADAVWPRPDKV